MPKSSPKNTAGPSPSTSAHASANTGHNKTPEHSVEEPSGKQVILGSMQDVVGLVTSLQNLIMQQNAEIKQLALKNQELEHKIQLQETTFESKIQMQVLLLESKLQAQDTKASEQERKLQELQEAFNKQTNTTENTLASHNEKLTRFSERPMPNVMGNAATWANVVKNGQNSASSSTSKKEEMYAHEDEKEYYEMEKRKMNIVIRGVAEKDEEQVAALNTEINDIIANAFGMQDIVVYGAHRVGKTKPDVNRAVVCTILDARKRNLILENARIFLKGSQYYISEDRTPNQQKARREAYDARTKKQPPTSEEEDKTE